MVCTLLLKRDSRELQKNLKIASENLVVLLGDFKCTKVLPQQKAHPATIVNRLSIKMCHIKTQMSSGDFNRIYVYHTDFLR